ncbi:DnaD domain-containing protein [Ectobacillus ponti]|uniref:DnaD domain protein n=1 Tax=Ectobacillus ponti TaxID=2961894 RepID=A0AA41X7X3_9BACI|nr:DnaD domain protein [Ectobacillus ponti]MCP8970544.1 DnaD domain protein [Ectobacillus ponti]
MNRVIQEIGGLNLRGNIIDNSWFQHIKTEAGKPHMLAIMILGDVVYWYRPMTHRDEETGAIEYKQRFRADKLQQNYQQFADKFGVSKVQVKRACDLLKDLNLVDIEFRNLVVNGTPLSNVMFIEPVPESIKYISSMYQKSKEVLTKKLPPSLQKSKGGPYEKVDTYTKTSTEITTNKDDDDNIHFSEQTSVQNEQTKCSNWTEDLLKMNRPLPEITSEITSEKKEDDDSTHQPQQNHPLYDPLYAKVVQTYQENIGVMSPIFAEQFGQWYEAMGQELMIEAIRRAVENNARKWGYIKKILSDWHDQNVKSLADVKALDTEFENRHKRKPDTSAKPPAKKKPRTFEYREEE